MQVEPVDGPETITLQVSSGGVQSYRRFGKVKVTIGDAVAELTIFANEHGLFLPFADALAGSETYGAGRYLESQPLGDGFFRVDFNGARPFSVLGFLGPLFASRCIPKFWGAHEQHK